MTATTTTTTMTNYEHWMTDRFRPMHQADYDLDQIRLYSVYTASCEPDFQKRIRQAFPEWFINDMNHQTREVNSDGYIDSVPMVLDFHNQMMDNKVVCSGITGSVMIAFAHNESEKAGIILKSYGMQSLVSLEKFSEAITEACNSFIKNAVEDFERRASNGN